MLLAHVEPLMGCVGGEEQINCGTITDMLISDVCPREMAAVEVSF